MSMTRPAHQHHPYPPPSPPPPPPCTLEITIVSGKHLKNVNWKNGDLKPYSIFWVDPDHKLTTKSDDSSNTKPVWNQRFSLSIPTAAAATTTTASPPWYDAVFTLEVFHSKTTETPKPFVGSLQIRLSSLPEPENTSMIRSFDLLRPSGRPQGKIRLKIGVNYQNAPVSGRYYYQNTPQYTYPYYGGGYYSSPNSFSERNLGYGAPSAPVDYSPYEPRTRAVPVFGPGLGVGAVGGLLGGLVLDESEKMGGGCSSSTIKDDFNDYRSDC
ncbi:hypothetical protein RND81_08G214800 [Saponaria officinalis]|uniref:C2 domain-containing protein n=1 Tax=Saponaria officinalis TaxID=3572 RepID=A0AAW1JA60_SAPOF